MSLLVRPARTALRSGWGWPVGLAVLAFTVRLSTLLRGSGLYGRVGYDGQVYYASASALAHGLLPYRDFLLLHPPGIVLALLPFAALGGVIDDAQAFALARVVWCVLGAVSTALVFVVVRPRGPGPALAAAALYAVFVPAVVSEDITTLEAVGSLCLLGALALLVRPWAGEATSNVPLVLAGVLLGLSTATKIWAVVVVLVVVGWSVRRLGLRRAGLVLGGAAASTVVVCLPFFLAAPGAMWRFVVLDQLGRRRVSEPLAGRVVDIAGLSELRGSLATNLLAVVAVLLVTVLVLLAVREPLGRFAALLLAVTAGLLLWTPPWSLAYTSFAAPAVALLVGSVVARLIDRSGRSRTPVAAAVGAVLVAYAALSLPGLPSGNHFPGRQLERILDRTPGCVTTDDPILLIETGALQRNFARHCPVVVDLSGYSWDLRPSASRQLSRQRNAQWQALALEHLSSGDASVVVRFRTLAGLSGDTRAVIAGWPLLGSVGELEVRSPDPQTTSPFPSGR